MSEPTHVVVIGGGYAGVLAANRLTRRTDVRVTLVNPRRTFVERIRLHQLVGGSDDAMVSYDDVLTPRVRLLVDRAELIEPYDRRVRLASGDTIGYDHLIYAVGSASTDSGVSGADEFAYPIASLEQAQRLRQVLDASPAEARVTVVGAGPTGIETAAELAALGRTVTLVCGAVLGPYLHPRSRRSVDDRLAALGITVLTGPGAQVTSVAHDAVTLSDERRLPSAVTIWTTGFGVPDLAHRSGLSTDGEGRLLTDETLTSVDDLHIVGAGDSTAPSNLPFRMSCQAAGPLGAQAADTVLSRIAGEQPAPLGMAFVGQCISLGRRDGLFQLARRNDVATPLRLVGRPAAALKELICRGTVAQLASEARRPGSFVLPRLVMDGRRQALLRDGRDDTTVLAGPAV